MIKLQAQTWTSQLNIQVCKILYMLQKNGSSMLTIQELFSWFSEDLTRVGEAALIESIQALTLLSSNLLVKLLLWEKPKNPLIKAIDSGTVAALGNTTVEIRLLIHDLTSDVTTLFCFVILAKQRLWKKKYWVMLWKITLMNEEFIERKKLRKKSDLVTWLA